MPIFKSENKTTGNKPSKASGMSIAKLNEIVQASKSWAEFKVAMAKLAEAVPAEATQEDKPKLWHTNPGHIVLNGEAGKNGKPMGLGISAEEYLERASNAIELATAQHDETTVGEDGEEQINSLKAKWEAKAPERTPTFLLDVGARIVCECGGYATNGWEAFGTKHDDLGHTVVTI